MKNLFKKRYSIVAIDKNGNKVTYENLFSTREKARSYCNFLKLKKKNWLSIKILDTKAKYYKAIIKYLAMFVAASVLAITFVSMLFIASFSQ